MIIGHLIPAGTGISRYRGIEVVEDDEDEVEKAGAGRGRGKKCLTRCGGTP